MKRPILIFLIGYIMGIIWELYLRMNIAPIILILIIIFILLKKNFRLYLILLIAILISSIQLYSLNTRLVGIYKEYKNEYIGIIISDKKEGVYYNTYTLRILKTNNKSHMNINVILKTKYELNYGDKINLTGTITKASVQRNYKGFDYSEYLKTKKVNGIIDNAKINKILSHNSLNKLDLIFHNTRLIIKENIKKIFENKEASILLALITGENEEIDEEIKENFRNAGIYHILAISGMHMAYIVLIFEKITNCINLNRNKKELFQIIAIIIFVEITTKSISILRASIMTILTIIASIVKKRSDIINNISIAMLIILIQNPYSIKDISFQLTFGGAIGILLLNKKITSIFLSLKINKNIAEKLSVIFSAQIFIIPILVLNFHTISLSFILSNFIIGYIIGPIIILGFIIISISFISIKTSIILAFPLNTLLRSLILITKYSAKLPFSKIYVIRPKIFLIVIYYMLILEFSKIKNFLKNNKNLNILKNKKIIILAMIILIILFNIPKNLKIHFIDVEQGDSTLIITPNKKTILIDSGGSKNYDIGEKILLPYLLNRGVKKIDYVIISHFDTDHVEGLLYVIQKIKVKNVIISKQAENSYNFQEFIKIAREKKINIIIVGAEESEHQQNNTTISTQRLKIEKDIYIDVLWPNESNIINENPLNNNSIVCKLIYKNFSMLFTGDIEEIAEREIIEEYKGTKCLKSTVLKVAHHGSRTSSTQRFLEIVNPEIALIGVGKNNTFGHPSNEVIQRLKENGAKIFRTDTDGEISITANKSGKIIKIEKCINEDT